MANHASSIKRHRQSEKRTTLNRWWKSRVRTSTKAVISACEEKKKTEAKKALLKAVSEIDKAQGKGVMHKNTAARKVARLSKHVSAL